MVGIAFGQSHAEKSGGEAKMRKEWCSVHYIGAVGAEARIHPSCRLNTETYTCATLMIPLWALVFASPGFGQHIPSNDRHSAAVLW
jgi:hypothetical protein